MANIKPFLSILTTTPLLLTSLQSMAEDDDVIGLEPTTSIIEEEPVETTLIKSKFSFDFIGLQSVHYSSSGFRFGLSHKPSEDSGLITNFALERFSDVTYVLSPTEFESEFTNLRWSAGYKFDVTNDFNITPSLGVVANLKELNAKTSQGFTNVKFAYDATDSFSLFIESTYDFGSNILPDSGSVGIGFKYTPHYSEPVVSLVDNTPTPIVPEPEVSAFDTAAPILVADIETSSVTGIVNGLELSEPVVEVKIEEATVQSDDYESMRFTIQVGVFRNMAAVNKFLQQNSISADETYTRESNGLVKIYYKGYDTRAIANKSLVSLKAKNVDGFVLNTPEKTINTPEEKTTEFVAIGPFYAVQLGSFSSLSSADSIINKMQGLDKKTFIKQAGALTKLYTGKFQSSSEAQAEVIKLKANNINGFVTKIN